MHFLNMIQSGTACYMHMAEMPKEIQTIQALLPNDTLTTIHGLEQKRRQLAISIFTRL